MQLEVKVSPTTIVKVQGKNCQEAFDALGEAQEIFGQNECGCCKRGGARCQVKHVKGYTFYQAVCQNPDCGAALTFVAYDGRMFPSRTNKDKSVKPNGGWEIYRKDQGGQAGSHEHEANYDNQDAEPPY
jgi:hypothetical protein